MFVCLASKLDYFKFFDNFFLESYLFHFLLVFTGSFVHCRSFMDSKVLMLIFVSLSSFDPNTRALGYYCLSQLYFHLEGANYGEKEIWLSLLESLRNSITSDNPRIPSIVTLFLARVTHIFTKPGDCWYFFICSLYFLFVGIHLQLRFFFFYCKFYSIFQIFLSASQGVHSNNINDHLFRLLHSNKDSLKNYVI